MINVSDIYPNLEVCHTVVGFELANSSEMVGYWCSAYIRFGDCELFTSTSCYA
jgi:hypothetical protein